MSGKRNCSLQEYTELVYEMCKNDYPKDFANGFKDYLKSEEAQQEIKNSYDYDIKKYKSGEMTEKQFFIGSVSATSYCLNMLY